MENRKNDKAQDMYLHTAYEQLYDRFVPGITPPEKEGPALWFIFKSEALLVISDTEENTSVPYGDLPFSKSDLEMEPVFMGYLDETPCFAAFCADKAEIAHSGFVAMRQLFTALSSIDFALAGLARQLVYWAATNRYCGACGAKTTHMSGERAMQCSRCGELYYPKVIPAVIVAVTKDDSLLLARSTRWKPSMYSVLAGFVEPGETLSQAVRREIREEAAVGVRNIRYFGSQPWPFPTQLMAAFTAEWESGDIVVDGKELSEARWVSREDISSIPIPGKISIARELIDWFSAGC